jgi:hypothetical protein
MRNLVPFAIPWKGIGVRTVIEMTKRWKWAGDNETYYIFGLPGNAVVEGRRHASYDE